MNRFPGPAISANTVFYEYFYSTHPAGKRSFFKYKQYMQTFDISTWLKNHYFQISMARHNSARMYNFGCYAWPKRARTPQLDLAR